MVTPAEQGTTDEVLQQQPCAPRLAARSRLVILPKTYVSTCPVTVDRRPLSTTGPPAELGGEEVELAGCRAPQAGLPATVASSGYVLAFAPYLLYLPDRSKHDGMSGWLSTYGVGTSRATTLPEIAAAPPAGKRTNEQTAGPDETQRPSASGTY